jgi:3-deoxy-D-manno-octulosonic-acid transferase
VAETIKSAGFEVIRRSQCGIANCKSQISNFKLDFLPVILGDTMGELRKFYSLADVVFVGRTLVDLGSRQHGSDMIEPAALAKPTIVGPFTGNFAEVMNLFRRADAIRDVSNADELRACLKSILFDSVTSQALDMGKRAQEVVRQSQGATARHVELILDHLNRSGNVSRNPRI